MPKVSVIIPTRNRADFLRSAIASVLNQTYQDFELIVVDDASKDNTREVVASFADSRIKYFCHQTGRGDGGARNTGIINSSADYIAFLDDDDQWLPEKLGLQLTVLENSPAHIGGVYTGQFDVNDTDGEISKICSPNRRGDLSQYLFKDPCIVTSTVLFRRECFEKLGLFDESIPYCNDYDMWIRIAKEYHFECIEEPLVKYLIHTNKLSTNFKLSIRGRELILEKYRQDFKHHRKAHGYGYQVLGETYCYDGNVEKGREAFLKSMKIYPFEIRCYVHFCLSLLGAKNFKATKEFVRQLFAPLRGRKLNSEFRKCVSQTLHPYGETPH